MSERSNLPEVRNWLKSIPEILALVASFSPEQRLLAKSAFLATSRRMRTKSDELWRKNKAPMAAYWRAKSVYARLFSHLIRK